VRWFWQAAGSSFILTDESGAYSESLAMKAFEIVSKPQEPPIGLDPG
jgi:hypothetical protein